MRYVRFNHIYYLFGGYVFTQDRLNPESFTIRRPPIVEERSLGHDDCYYSTIGLHLCALQGDHVFADRVECIRDFIIKWRHAIYSIYKLYWAYLSRKIKEMGPVRRAPQSCIEDRRVIMGSLYSRPSLLIHRGWSPL